MLKFLGKNKDDSVIANKFDLANALQRLNPKVKIKYDETTGHYIIMSCNPEQLVLPQKFYYTRKDGITNKGNSNGDEDISLIPLVSFDR